MDGEVVANIPVNAGALGFALSPFLATIGLSAAIITKHTIEITKDDGQIVDLKEISGKSTDQSNSDSKEDEKDLDSN